jgi:hypothetical protein
VKENLVYTKRSYHANWNLYWYSTRSITPLFVIPGNKRSKLPASAGDSMAFGRIEYDSQSWTKRRSRSNHCPELLLQCLPTLAPPLMGQGVRHRIVICRRSRCLGEMVWSAVMTHWTLHDLSRNTTSFEFCRFRKVDRS